MAKTEVAERWISGTATLLDGRGLAHRAWRERGERYVASTSCGESVLIAHNFRPIESQPISCLLCLFKVYG